MTKPRIKHNPIKEAMDFARDGRPSAHIGALDGGDTRAVALLLCVPSGPSVTGEDMRMYRALKAKFLQMLTNFEDAVQLSEESAHAS